MSNRLWVIGVGIAFLLGYYKYIEFERNETAKSVAQYEKNMNDPNSPPVLSERMRDPSWNIAYWIDVDRKSSDCIMADEIMDAGGNVKVSYKRGAETSRHYLSEYISSCSNRVNRTIEQVERPARKWCAFKNNDPRLAQLCSEWSNNKNIYLNKIKQLDAPTLNRYENYPNK
ncbi:hypothetical protein [Hafnia paralvei]|uniref:hypothetical protein n=1 Tax=Enterobacterales TaxID=91347 RepID=UPI001F172BBE|nr:hypothetical protein [Hafnia paralvei]MCE9907634.1 hypothetical protein [Hafnia paralvei]MCE9913744.1 hypothetical protein [Hafnia paralvei]